LAAPYQLPGFPNYYLTKQIVVSLGNGAYAASGQLILEYQTVDPNTGKYRETGKV
jgi:hypothetical protein